MVRWQLFLDSNAYFLIFSVIMIHRCSYPLPSPKAQAVAQETLVIWCSLASRLGLWAMKAELEDLCFAVIQVVMHQLFHA